MLIFIELVSCNQNKQKKGQTASEKIEFSEIIKKGYELYKPRKEVKAVLILFGGYPEIAEDIKREFEILDVAINNNIVVVLSNFNRRLWLEENEKHQLAQSLQNIIAENGLPKDNIFIGGFSSGGIVSLLISDFLIGKKQFQIIPKGVFVVDSPVDLSGIYFYCKKSINLSFSEISVKESQFLLNLLKTNLGNPLDDFQTYEDKSVFTLSTNNTRNIKNLKNTKIRFYTEPDSIWWKKNRMMDYEDINAYYIHKLSERLIEQGFNNIEYIPTANRGHRSSGDRHPHSWSIVDNKDLINWILTK